jgi:hypothetical protein
MLKYSVKTPQTWKAKKKKKKTVVMALKKFGALTKVSKSKSHYDRRSVFVSVTIWGPRPNFCYRQAIVILLLLLFLFGRPVSGDGGSLIYRS